LLAEIRPSTAKGEMDDGFSILGSDKVCSFCLRAWPIMQQALQDLVTATEQKYTAI
jgi:hypothetical protein